MNRAERSTNAQGSNFSNNQAAVMLEDQVRHRTEDLETALRDNKKITRELHAAQSNLLATAREAGMAEIATNVLHNIGNVLNSVNISTGLINSKIRDSKAQGLTKAVQMLNEHTEDLGEFLTHDDKGKLIPSYLNKLVAALALEQQNIIEELESLTKNVNHIKSIVATQQSYAGRTNVIEAVKVSNLLDDAIRINSNALARHWVTVVKEFAEVPLLMLDKSQLLQVLVNLISNAKQAMENVMNQSHQLTVQMKIIDLANEQRLQIRVKDNGEGITQESMAQLFVHGFTTRKNGHGFGLHSCVLAAKQMGGTLTAHSDGLGKGALFTLELPAKPVEDVQ